MQCVQGLTHWSSRAANDGHTTRQAGAQQEARLDGAQEDSAGFDFSVTCTPSALPFLPGDGEGIWTADAPQQHPDPASVVVIMRHARSQGAKAEPQPPRSASTATCLQPAAMPLTPHTAPPAYIDLTLTDSDDDREPRTPSPLARSCLAARASSLTSCQTPPSLRDGNLDAAARLGRARKLQHAWLPPCQSQATAACHMPAPGGGAAFHPSDRDDTPESGHSKGSASHSAGIRPVAPARDVLAQRSAPADVETAGDVYAKPLRSHAPAEEKHSSPHIRCSRRVQERAFQALTGASRRPSLIVAYPLGSEEDQNYIDSLDMTADLAAALGIPCTSIDATAGGSRWSRISRTHCDSLLTRLATAIKVASDITDSELLSPDGSHEDALVHGIWKAVRSP